MYKGRLILAHGAVRRAMLTQTKLEAVSLAEELNRWWMGQAVKAMGSRVSLAVCNCRRKRMLSSP